MDNKGWMCLHPDPSLRRGLESLGAFCSSGAFSTHLGLQLPLWPGEPPAPWTPEDVNDNICSNINLSSGEDCSFSRYTETTSVSAELLWLQLGSCWQDSRMFSAIHPRQGHRLHPALPPPCNAALAPSCTISGWRKRHLKKYEPTHLKDHSLK